ncbi:peptidoglycan-binding protein [Curtobacterium sp. PhB115]|uniref:peptidoglycan-binding domain-containing protein n=1 Tax=Curtobacterium sp. PhB115 TaxID=2485173 RepID=UPI000F4C9FC2|nr:hypothetical protein [Curtobacterium sp. PhB115]ROP74714.1 hypothetical protein EDF19_0800 [Curtobacterium sp. PhB115]
MRWPSGTLVGLGVLVVAAGVAAGVVVALPIEPPAALATATPASTVRATERTDADERQVQLTLDAGSPRAVVTTRTGTVTASSCSTGGVLRSGDVAARIDGAPVVALASGVPLWRDLELDDRGDDVSGLQQELTRLGAGLSVDGILGRGTLRAAQQFLVDRGVPRTDLLQDGIPRDAFSWLPAAESTVQTCAAVVGAPVGADGVLAELPAELRGARIDATPVDPAPGDRVLRVGSAEVPIDAHGVVSSTETLAEVAALPEYAVTVGSADGAPTLPAAWSLRHPRVVHVLPPTALFAVTGGRACVQPTSGGPIRVEVLGSELGQAFVRPVDGRTLDRVRATPDPGRPCR